MAAKAWAPLLTSIGKCTWLSSWLNLLFLQFFIIVSCHYPVTSLIAPFFLYSFNSKTWGAQNMSCVFPPWPSCHVSWTFHNFSEERTISCVCIPFLNPHFGEVHLGIVHHTIPQPSLCCWCTSRCVHTPRRGADHPCWQNRDLCQTANPHMGSGKALRRYHREKSSHGSQNT